jgi:hypothetical protein
VRSILGRIYLDQKDYSRIARGLLGDPHFKEDLEAYQFLIPFVDSHKLLIYSSWCHLFEALKYNEEKIDLLNPYCDAIDTLTEGNCIIWPETIEKRELELFFARHFGFTSEVSDKDYPYGNPKDLIFVGDTFGPIFDSKESLINNLKKELDRSFLLGKEKRFILKKLSKPKRLRELLEKLPEENLRPLYKQFPGFEKTFTKNVIIDFLLSSPKEKSIFFEDAIQTAFTFKNLIIHYSRIFPQLKEAVHCFDASSTQIRSTLRMNQVLYDVFGKHAINEVKTSKDLVNGFADNFNEEIIGLANKFKFPINEARKLLLKTKFEGIPSVKSTIFFIIEYYKKHKGTYKKGRNPLESDIMDLHHLRNFPYVDFYVTDRFFADIAKKGEGLFKTKVFLNLSELHKYLNKKKGDDSIS